MNTNKKYEKFITAKTAWFENLVANNAFLNNLTANDGFIKQLVTGSLFTKNITLKNGGIIQSENYKSGTSGWKIDSNGDVEFSRGVFNGGYIKIGEKFTVDTEGRTEIFKGHFSTECIFEGDIKSGPLEVSNKTPSISNKKIYSSGEQLYKNFEFVNNKRYIGPVNGSYGSYSWSYLDIVFDISYYLGSVAYYNVSFILFDENKNKVYEKKWTNVYKEHPKAEYDCLYKEIISSTAKTIKMSNLPTAEPSESGIIWTDANGYLRIKK